MPSVSVLVPCYQSEAFLPETLDAILRQLPADGEVVACDNASTDRTFEILEAYASRDRRLRSFRNPENVGSVRNSNGCLARAASNWATFICSDDLPAPAAIPVSLEAAQTFAGCGLVFGRYVEFAGAPPAVEAEGAGAPGVLAWPDSFSFMVAAGNRVPFSTALFRVDLARRLGGLRADRLYTADYRFWLGLSSLAEVCVLDRTTMYYRVREGSESDPHRRGPDALMEVHLAMLERWAELTPDRRRAWEARRGEAARIYVRALWVSLYGDAHGGRLGPALRAAAMNLGPPAPLRAALLATRVAAVAVRPLRGALRGDR